MESVIYNGKKILLDYHRASEELNPSWKGWFILSAEGDAQGIIPYQESDNDYIRHYKKIEKQAKRDIILNALKNCRNPNSRLERIIRITQDVVVNIRNNFIGIKIALEGKAIFKIQENQND